MSDEKLKIFGDFYRATGQELAGIVGKPRVYPPPGNLGWLLREEL